MFRLVLEGLDEALLPFDALGPLAVEGRARPPYSFAPPYGSLGLLGLAAPRACRGPGLARGLLSRRAASRRSRAAVSSALFSARSRSTAATQPRRCSASLSA